MFGDCKVTSALKGIKILEMTRFIAGPYAGGILASLGADVVKIEPPSGDVVRGFGPTRNEVGIPFELLNHNKRSLIVDLKKPSGREIIKRLAQTADIVLESSKPGTAERLGVSYDELKVVNPRLIYCSISGFGQEGPYRNLGGVDIVAQAIGGLMGITGTPGGAPVKISLPITDIGCGMWATIGILSALAAREHTGTGQRIDAALLDTPIAWSFWEASRYFGLGEKPRPLGSSHRNVAPYRAFECSDGRYIVIGAASQPLWEKLCTATELTDLLDDERFASPPLRVDNRSELEPLLEPKFLEKSSNDWLDILNGAGVPCGPVNTYEEAVGDPQVKIRNLVADVQHSKAGPLKFLDVPVYLSNTPRAVLHQAPALGEHSTQVLVENGFNKDEIQHLLAEQVIVQSNR